MGRVLNSSMTSLFTSQSVFEYRPVLMKSNSLTAVDNKKYQLENGAVISNGNAIFATANVPDTSTISSVEQKNGEDVPVALDTAEGETDEEDSTTYDTKSEDSSDEPDMHTTVPDDFLEKIEVVKIVKTMQFVWVSILTH